MTVQEFIDGIVNLRDAARDNRDYYHAAFTECDDVDVDIALRIYRDYDMWRKMSDTLTDAIYCAKVAEAKRDEE